MTTAERPDWLEVLARGAARGEIPAGGLMWEEPPPSEVGHPAARVLRDNVGDAPPPPLPLIAAITALLRTRPFVWARVYTGSRDVAQNLTLQVRGGYRGWHYAGQFESTRRTVDGETVVWARFTPFAFANVLIEAGDDWSGEQ